MSLPWGETIAAAVRRPVRISGSWDGDGLRPGAICTWRGIATADEEIAASLVVEHFGAIGWSRSRRSRADGLDLAISVYLPDRPDFRPWVNLEAGGASLLWQAPWPGGTSVVIARNRDAETGRLIPLAATVGREDAARFGVLVLARSDIKVGRKRIWRARGAIRSEDRALELILRGPRWGWDPALR